MQIFVILSSRTHFACTHRTWMMYVADIPILSIDHLSLHAAAEFVLHKED